MSAPVSSAERIFVFGTPDATIILKSINEELTQMIGSLSTASPASLNLRLEGIFKKFILCRNGSEAYSNPVGIAKNLGVVKEIQKNYETIALNLRNRCWSLEVMLLGHYSSASDAKLADMKKPWLEDSSIAGEMARILRASIKK